MIARGLLRGVATDSVVVQTRPPDDAFQLAADQPDHAAVPGHVCARVKHLVLR